MAQKAGGLLQDKATHTGTLDPAAEGVLVVLTGPDRYKKTELSSFTKVYEAEILLGVSTDTHDLIGLPTEIYPDGCSITLEEVEAKLPLFQGELKQQQPIFSAQRVAGTAAFELASKQHSFVPKTNSITISSITLLSSKHITGSDLQDYQARLLKKIDGSFRQQEIAESWASTMATLANPSSTQYPVLRIKVVCSKRTYIRALVRDLSRELGTPATLFSLLRSKNGPYAVQDCLCLI